MSASTTSATIEVPRVRRVLGGPAAGLVAATIGVTVWVALNQALTVEMGWVAIALGAGVGSAVALGAASRSRFVVPALAVILTLVGSVVADNFLQRAHLVQGIDSLQSQWADLHIQPVVVPPATAPGTDGIATDATGTNGSTTVAPATCPANSDLVPPPQIVKVLPLVAYGCMTPKILAVIYNDVPPEIKAQLPPKLKADAEALIAADAAAAQDKRAQDDLAAAKAAFSATSYDIPRPVLVCAPPPDFTQPNATAALGFPNGVPLFLPGGDLFQKPLARGDGQSYPAASPVCFATENAKDHPLQALSWLIGAALAGALAFRFRRRARPPSADLSAPVAVAAT